MSHTDLNQSDDDDDYCPTKTESESSDEEKVQEETNTTKPYDQSKTDELWKNFNSTTNNKPLTTPEPPKPVTIEKKVFDFAGEKISVPVPTTSSTLKRPASSSFSTGSNSLLDRLGLGKKPKLSTLEKSRLDWQTHKETEALTEDLESHRRGKDSYVEKKAFLQRTETREHDHYLNRSQKK